MRFIGLRVWDFIWFRALPVCASSGAEGIVVIWILPIGP